LSIQNTGSMSFHTPKSSFHLSKVLHCPQAYANLLSINQFCRDSDCFFSSMVPITLLRTTARASLYWKAGVKAVSTLFICSHSQSISSMP
jgi:hypothetical protein